jgi:predicted DNA-binding protein
MNTLESPLSIEWNPSYKIPKSDEFISVRVTPRFKEKLKLVSESQRWTISQTVKKALKQYFNEEV